MSFTEKIRSKIKNNCYITYTLMFILVSLIVFSYFYLNGKTFISHGDGWKQHYKALLYYSKYLKEVFRIIFSERSLAIPQWDFSIGEGSDILGAMHYYCIGDPFAFFSVLVPESLMYAYYDFMVLIKMYLAGLIFTVLCRYVGKKDPYAILSGSLIYVFCYWSMLNSNKHIFFLTPMVYLPLIILGVEKIIRGERPFVFVLAVFLCAISHIYFFYMNVLLTVIFVAIRLIILYRTDLRSMFNVVLKLFINAVLALGLAAVILVPMVYVLLNNNRIGVDYGSHLFYERFYYERLFTILFADDYPYWLCMGFASPVVLSMALAVKDLRKSPFIFVINLVGFLMICFPIVGRIFNGMGYVANRWSYALALIAGYTFVCEYEEFENNRRYLLFAVPLFLIAGYVSAWSRTIRVIVPTLICLVYLGVVLSKIKHKDIILLVVLISSIAFNADHIYSLRGDDQRAYSAVSKEAAKNVVYSNEAYEFKEYLQDHQITDFVRFTGNDLSDNVAMLNDVYGTNYYFSMANPYTANFRSLLGVTEYSAYRFYSLDQRSALFTPGNVGYYIATNDFEGPIPYGFEYVEDLKNYRLYQNKYLIPFGYTYDRSMPYEEWLKLDPVEREEVMLSAVVTDEGTSSVDLQSVAVPYTVNHGDEIEIEENKIYVKEKNAVMTLEFEGLEDCENYFLFEGLSYWDGNTYYDESLTDVEVEVLSGKAESTIEYHTNDYSFYNARSDFAAYLGHDDEPRTSVTLTFSAPGAYSFEKMKVICRPVSDYGQKIEKLRENTLSGLEIGNDMLSGVISTDKEKYLLLSIPYSKGWKAYIDGKDTEVLRANECYMALKVSKGTHMIELRYETPMLKAGALISLVSYVGLVINLLVRRKQKRS